MLCLPVAIWLTERVSRFLARRDAAEDQWELVQIDAATGRCDESADLLALIQALTDEEIALIREVLDIRFSGSHVTLDQASALRRAHRRGLAARRRCGDPFIDAELSWLQGFGSFALMADLSEFDQAHFDRELAHRASGLRRAIALRRGSDARHPTTVLHSSS